MWRDLWLIPATANYEFTEVFSTFSSAEAEIELKRLTVDNSKSAGS